MCVGVRKQQHMSSRTSLVFGLGFALVCLPLAQTTWACSDTPDNAEPSTPPVSATQVRFSEFFPAPSDGDEFIELEVQDEGGGDLNGWSIQDASGKQFVFESSQMETEVDRFMVVDQTTSKLSLNNTGDSLDLIDPSGAVVEHQEYTTAPTDETWSRLERGWEWSTATPGEENVEPGEDDTDSDEDTGDETEDDVKDDSDEESDSEDEQEDGGTGAEVVESVRLNELLPNPAGNEAIDEWFELVNEGESGTLKGWVVTDGTSTFELPDVVIETAGFVVVGIAESGINLNNTGDILYLIDPNDVIVQGVEYGSAPEAESFSRFGESWEWMTELTPGSANVAVVEDPEEANEGEEGDTSDEETEDQPEEEELEVVEQFSIADLKTLEKGTAVTAQGVVEVEAGPLGGQVIYIQDETAGIQVYAYHKDFPSDMVRGSLVSVTGVMSSAYGEVRVNSDEGGISVMGQEDEVMPKGVDELVVDDVGSLVVVSGTVSSKTSSRLTLERGIEVYVKSSTNISLSGVSAGNVVQVVGIVNQYNDTLRLLPREQEDIQVQTSEDTVGVSSASAATLGQGGSADPTATGAGQSSSSWSIKGAAANTAPGWVVLGLAAGVLVVGVVRQWWKKQGVAKRLFPSYTAKHEIKGSVDSGRNIPTELHPRVGP